MKEAAFSFGPFQIMRIRKKDFSIFDNAKNSAHFIHHAQIVAHFLKFGQ